MSRVTRGAFEMCRELGGDYRWRLDAACTHLIYPEAAEEDEEPDAQLTDSRRAGLHVVPPKWLALCTGAKARVPESQFTARISVSNEGPKRRSLDRGSAGAAAASRSLEKRLSEEQGQFAIPSPISSAPLRRLTLTDPRKSRSSGDSRMKAGRSGTEEIMDLTGGDGVLSKTRKPSPSPVQTEQQSNELIAMMTTVVNSAPLRRSGETSAESSVVSAKAAALLSASLPAPPSKETAASLESQGVEWQDSLADQPPARRLSPLLPLTEELPPTLAAASPQPVIDLSGQSIDVTVGPTAPVFCLTGVSAGTKEKTAALISELGGTLSDDVLATTHLLLGPGLSRNEKAMVHVAKGAWVLHPDYVAASADADHFLSEADFEWGGPGLTDRRLASEEQNRKAKHYSFWRQSVQAGGAKAFSGWRTMIVAASDAKRASLARILMSGGAALVESELDKMPISLNDFSHVISAKPYPDWWNEAAAVTLAVQASCEIFHSIHLANTLEQCGNAEARPDLVPAFRAARDKNDQE